MAQPIMLNKNIKAKTAIALKLSRLILKLCPYGAVYYAKQKHKEQNI
jgi:L-cystine uptake protein TcyP (sodium:dicarboxylate symporter family)